MSANESVYTSSPATETPQSEATSPSRRRWRTAAGVALMWAVCIVLICVESLAFAQRSLWLGILAVAVAYVALHFLRARFFSPRDGARQ